MQRNAVVHRIERRADSHNGLGQSENTLAKFTFWDSNHERMKSVRGIGPAGALLRRLAAYPRQNAQARALRKIGCLVTKVHKKPRANLDAAPEGRAAEELGKKADPVHPRLDLRSGAQAPFQRWAQ